MVREIPLTQDKVALVDDRDYDRVMEHKWCAVNNNGHWYAKRHIRQDGKTFLVYLHRFILGVPDGVRVDHRDGDGLNCTWENVRLATPKENAWNAKTGRNNTTGFKGVARYKSRFRVQIRENGRNFNLGLYDTAEDAARARDAAAYLLHGDFAWTNFPDIDPNIAEDVLARLTGSHENNSKPMAILTPEQVVEMRNRYASGGIVGRELAADYGVQPATVYHALSGRSWRDTDGPTGKSSYGKPKSSVPHELGETVRRLRKERGWSQRELGERAGGGLTQPDISNIELHRQQPGQQRITLLASAFDLTPGDLLTARAREVAA